MFDNTNTKIQGHLSKKLRKIKINVDPPPPPPPPVNPGLNY